jgi:hypothetical protein
MQVDPVGADCSTEFLIGDDGSWLRRHDQCSACLIHLCRAIEGVSERRLAAGDAGAAFVSSASGRWL